MDIYLIIEEDEENVEKKPFGLSFDNAFEGFVGFKSIKMAKYFINTISNLKNYKPIKIGKIPKSKLKMYDKVVIFETESNVHSIFSGTIKTLVKNAIDLSKIMPNSI